jgi:hypothetical protein
MKMRVFRGAGAFPWIGLAFAVVGILFLASILMSPGGWQWWMDAKAVHGNEQSGVIYYSYRGVSYSVVDPNSTGSSPRTVYVVASDPGNADLHSATATVVLDWTITGGPLIVGASFLAFGFLRRTSTSRMRRGVGDRPGQSFGDGLDSETVERLLANQRADGQIRAAPPVPEGQQPDD